MVVLVVKVNNGGSSAIIVIIDAVAVVNSGIKACFNLYCFSMMSLGLNKDSHSTSLHAASKPEVATRGTAPCWQFKKNAS